MYKKISCDMIRLSTRIKRDDFNLFILELKIDVNIFIKYYSTTDSRKFRHNWTFTNDIYSYYFAFSHNSQTDLEFSNFTIEFNPNKVSIDDKILSEILFVWFCPSRLFNLKNACKIKSCDIAFDFSENIFNVIVNKGLKRRFMTLSDGKGIDDITYYIGKGDGRVKIYNKGKKENYDYDLTRYEISLEIDSDLDCIKIKSNDENYPTIRIIDNQFSFLVDVEDKIFLLGLLSDTSLVNQLSRKKKLKYSFLLNSLNTFQPQNKDILIVLNDFKIKWINK